MLKRNKMLIAFMLVAVLCVSVGFATLTDTLTATGGLTLNVPGAGETPDPENPIVNNFDEDVYFYAVGGATVTGSAVAANATATINTDVDTITITIADGTFTDATETVTFVATIKNDAAYEVTLGDTVIGNTNAHFTVEGTLGAKKIASKGTTTLTITVTLNAIPAESITNAQFTVAVTAQPTDK